jgi:hypothetical protein
MKKFLSLVFITSLLFSCGPNRIEQGELTYEVTYPNMEVTGIMSAILPKEMTIVFKGTKMKTTIARGRIFTTDVITNEADNSMEMRLDFGDKKYYCIMTAAEVEQLKNTNPVYNVTATSEADSLNGLWAKKYTVTSEDSLQPGDAWFTEGLEVQNGAWFSAYAGTVGMPLIYDVERWGLMMHVVSNNFIEREVKDDEFDRDPALTEVDFETYESEVQELFDILLE